MGNRSALVAAMLCAVACSPPASNGTNGPTGTATTGSGGESQGVDGTSGANTGAEASGGTGSGGSSSGGSSGGKILSGAGGNGIGGAVAGGTAPGGAPALGGSAQGGDAPGGTGPDPDVVPVSPDRDAYVEYLEQVNEAVLDLYARCLNRSATHAQLDGTVLEREHYVPLVVEAALTNWKRSLEAGRLQLDTGAAAACLEHVESESCEELLREEATLSTCWQEVPLVGLVPRGEQCWTLNDCADPSDYCADNINACPQRSCAPRDLEGDPCETFSCEQGLSCPGTGICTKTGLEQGIDCPLNVRCQEGLTCLGTCQPYVASLPCESTFDCPRPHEVCSFEPGETLGTCGAPKAAGEPCSFQLERVDLHDCALGLDCVGEPGSETCTANWVAAGETCRTGEHFISCVEGTCGSVDPGTREGTCIPFAEEGDSCAERSCRPGFECGVDGVCAPPVPPCLSARCATGQLCENGECVPAILPGEACMDDFECGNLAACVGSICEWCE